MALQPSPSGQVIILLCVSTAFGLQVHLALRMSWTANSDL